MEPTMVSVKYPCGHEVEYPAGSRTSESCSACALGIPEGASRCEDFPCCGHTDGDGCMPNPRHTSDYWRDRFSRMTDEEIEYRDQMGDWD